MDIKPIRTEADYEEALGEIERLWAAPYGSPEGDKLNVLATLVEVYEEKHYPIPPFHLPIQQSSHKIEGTMKKICVPHEATISHKQRSNRKSRL